MMNREVNSVLAQKFGRGAKFAALATLACVMAMTIAPAARAQDVSMTVQLTSALSSGSLHKGDSFTAQIASPAAFQGDTIRGKISQTGSSHGQATVDITFTTITHNGLDVPVVTTIQGVTNSKGHQATDDQGRAVRASNVSAKQGGHSGLGSRLGGQLGGMVGGRTGEAASDASSDVPAGGSAPPAIQIAAQGPSLDLSVGASIMLSVKSNGGESLESLPPNAPGSTPPSAVGAMGATGPAGSPGSGGASGASSSTGATGASSASSGQAAGGASGAAQPELKSVKIEFVPGEKTVFFDDFSDMVPDEPPPHWKVREGTVELRSGGDIRELVGTEGVHLSSSTFVMPANFTFELTWTGTGEMAWHFLDKSDSEMMVAVIRGEESGDTATASVSVPDGALGSGEIKTDTSKPVVFALWAQQGRVRAYLNGQRVVDANQVQFGPMDHLYVDDSRYRPNGIRQVRVAESAPDFSAVINASGKYVTHGINFDTDSDHLKPESGAVLKQVAAALGKNPNLKLEIDGYTDSVGNAAHNLDLSKRRALAVQSVLVSQFGIDASRLTSNGFGADKPMGSNDTPDGRAQNRRVEFIKK
jgi:OmpA-OmpF porin, OOP family